MGGTSGGPQPSRSRRRIWDLPTKCTVEVPGGRVRVETAGGSGSVIPRARPQACDVDQKFRLKPRWVYGAGSDPGIRPPGAPCYAVRGSLRLITSPQPRYRVEGSGVELVERDHPLGGLAVGAVFFSSRNRSAARVTGIKRRPEERSDSQTESSSRGTSDDCPCRPVVEQRPVIGSTRPAPSWWVPHENHVGTGPDRRCHGRPLR